MAISILGFFLMFGASCLGFVIAWLFQKQKLVAIQANQQKKQRAYDRLREEYDVLLKHSNSLQAEKNKFHEDTEYLNNKLREQKELSYQLEADKEFIFKEYEQFRLSVKDKLESNKQVLTAFEQLKEKNQKVKLKTDKWRVKYHEVLTSLQKVESEFRAVKKQRDHLQEKLETTKPEQTSVFEWESNYKELKLRYLALAKEKKDLEQRLQILEIEAVETDKNRLELNELVNKVAILKRENELLAGKLNQHKSVESLEGNDEILSRIGRKKDKVDFGRIGKASPTQKDNLQLIKGIGPFIEQKLNALGIFHFHQIAHFKDRDIKEINTIIELAPGHIKMDDWVGQASRMK